MNTKARARGIILLFTSLFIFMLGPGVVFAAEGYCGYEGGISSGIAVNKIYEYKEVVFITGKPIIVQGNLTVKSTIKANAETWTYSYTNLKDKDNTTTLNRTISYDVAVANKENGQIQKQVSIKGTPSEVIKVNKKTYTLKKYTFSKSTLEDIKPIANYFAGEFMGEKTYNVTDGTSTKTGAVKITSKGKVFGYNQNWSNTEAQNVEYNVKDTENDLGWSGTINMGISMTENKNMSYEENKPEAISFEGGYVQTDKIASVLQYETEFPEFDSSGNPTDYLVKSQDTLDFDTTPEVTRLAAPALNKIKGHWAENDIKSLFALEIFKEKAEDFNPNDYVTRSEFARIMVMTGKLMNDTDIAAAEAKFDTPSTPKANATSKKNTEVQIFDDVPTDYPYYSYITKAYNSKIMNGVSGKLFHPQEAITRAQAVTLIIRALGFEDRAPSPAAVTSFKDNDSIPSWARSSAYVAEKLGLVRGDSYNNFNPNSKMTKSEVAVMINRFVNYMRQDIIKDYKDNAVLY